MTFVRFEHDTINNRKGILYVQSTQNAHVFEQHANPQGYQVRAVINRDNEELTCSAWYLAATLKAAEQAAAEDVLKSLGNGPASEQDHVSVGDPEQQGGELNAAMVLNELKQVGILQSFGYEVVNEDGPSHQPVFSIVAWTTTPDGQTWHTAPVRGSSKKSGQRSAAEGLLALLVEHGITRR
jgi:dsRNA-specific ribonuclease